MSSKTVTLLNGNYFGIEASTREVWAHTHVFYVYIKACIFKIGKYRENISNLFFNEW